VRQVMENGTEKCARRNRNNPDDRMRDHRPVIPTRNCKVGRRGRAYAAALPPDTANSDAGDAYLKALRLLQITYFYNHHLTPFMRLWVFRGGLHYGP
jgi:hypothetical protein